MNDFIELSPKETWQCISPYVCVDQNYDRLASPLIRRTLKAAIKKIIRKNSHEVKRTEEYVSFAYHDKWLSRDITTSVSLGGQVCTKWNSNRFIVYGAGLRKLHTLRLMRLIDKLKPKTVIDIGCGNGERILQLACRFPEIQFTGLELTPSGIEAAKKIQALDALPRQLAEFSPEPLQDLTVHKSVNFICGSAKKTLFDDNSFDLLYTSLSLEQMDLIRKEVLCELYRITNKFASFYEAFSDFNRGLVQRAYVFGEAYFTGSLQELESVGFRDIVVSCDLPQKIYMNTVHVLAKK